MLSPRNLSLRLLSCGLIWLASATRAPGVDVKRADALPLDGTWSFRFAPDDRGSSEAWFTPGVPFDRTMTVPGCWDAQKVGSATDKMTHNAIGVGWYRRTFALPDAWRDRRVWLNVGGAHRSVRVWVNGKPCGEHIGYPTAHRVEISRLLVPGAEQSVALAVDSRHDKRRDPLVGAFDIIDFMDLTWGGLFEHVWLDCTGPSRVESAFVRPDPAGPAADLEIAVDRGPATSSLLALAVEVRRAEAPAGTPALARAEQTLPAAATTARIALRLPGAPLWTPDSPNLLRAEIRLVRDGHADDACSVRFGLRRVEVVGSEFRLNGERIFLRGYGDDYTFPLDLGTNGDVSAWKAYLRRRKEFGFNFVRHHSTMVPESYLAAADEVGMLVQPELPIAYDPFFQAATPEGRTLYLDVLRDYVRQMRNHPSVFAWCMGNEEANGFALGPDLVALARSLDPTRPVIDTDGVGPGAARPTMDYLPIQFDENVLPWGSTRSKYHVDARQPVIVHEMANISVLPDPADIPHYTGVIRPFWLERMAAAVKRQGLEARLPAMLAASRGLQASLLKLNTEAARLSPGIDGYDQWLFRDYWTQSTGFVDQFDRSRLLSPETAIRFNGPAVLLWDRPRVSYRGGERVEIRLFLSDFRTAAEGPIGPVSVRLGGREIPLSPPASAGARGLIGPWVGEVEAPRSGRPEVVTLEATAGRVRNAWPVWVFPETPASANGVVVVARRLSRKVLDQLAAGARVVVTDETRVFPFLAAAFKPAWWKGDDVGDHGYGNLFADHPALRGFPNDGYGDLQAFRLLDRRPAVLLDELPAKVDPIVWALDVPWRMRRKAHLFEVKVGPGRLLVSTMDLSPKTCADDPAAGWLRHQLIRYAAGDEFKPAAELPVTWLRGRVERDPPPDTTTWVEGFGGNVSSTIAPARWLTDREDDVPVYPLRQTDGKQRLAWDTAPVPADWPHPTVTFAWAGGIGWQSQPGGGGFSLSLDGAPLVEFAFTRTTTETASRDGRARLTYQVRRTTPEDTFGLFLLTVPTDRLRRGRPARIELGASAQNSQRWVSLAPYNDVVRSERDAP